MKIFQLFLALLLLTVIFYESVNSQNINLTPCLTGDWTACGIAVGTAIYKKYNSWSDIDTKPAFGTICNSEFKGGWYRRQ
ncbi:unnamed protein product [Rotaria sp. Silwood2]|nr:unnamed protein product [Rotaria sp. Silwood2]CAF4373000.1 unnamed protein product [Rotaria sp. Silwood2]